MSTYAYVNPIVAVILGWLILQEPIDARTIVAGVVIVVAVALIVTSRGRMQRPSRAEPLAAVTSPHRTVRVTCRASAMIVIIGFTPIPVGNREPSAT